MNARGRGLKLMFAVGIGWGNWPMATPVSGQVFTEIAADLDMNAIGAGAGWGDYDNDGDLDLYVARFRESNLLFRNNGDGSFAEIGVSAGVNTSNDGVAMAWGDYNNDGNLDLYVANFSDAQSGKNKLYKNNGDRSFTEVGTSAGVAHLGYGQGVAWGDYDNDGDLDLYAVNRIGPDWLYQNNGDGTFADVTTSTGIQGNDRKRGAAWGDYDNDGDLDLYVTFPDTTLGNPLYQNNGDGTFTDVAASAGVDDVRGGAVGPAWGDYDNDGDLDLYVTNAQSPNRLFQNNGDGKFTEMGASAGVNDPDGHGVGWADYDNDGDLDIFVASNGPPNRMYRNNADGTFTNMAADYGMEFTGVFGSAVAWGDYDNDGDLDLYVGNFEDLNLFYRNEGTPNHWLQVKLQGTASNRSAIGTRVIAITGTKRQRWDVDGGSGFCSQPSLPVEFGFGQTTIVDSLCIFWPSGMMQVFTGVATDQRLAITEANPLITAVEEEEEAARPTAYALSQNYPNPFNPQTTIHYQIPEALEIRLSILNLTGQELRVLAQGMQQPGQYRAVWDGMDASDRAVASGVYLYRLEVVGQGIIETKRMALVR